MFKLCPCASAVRVVPFGGYKRSGNGCECGEPAFHEFLETKAVMGYGVTQPA
jgi:aldehyde dehydrogenase (NAD+)